MLKGASIFEVDDILVAVYFLVFLKNNVKHLHCYDDLCSRRTNVYRVNYISVHFWFT